VADPLTCDLHVACPITSLPLGDKALLLFCPDVRSADDAAIFVVLIANKGVELSAASRLRVESLDAKPLSHLRRPERRRE
jgi:hypothetical protein